MTVLADRVTVARRFQRSIRIDLDMCKPEALEGFVCPRSSAYLLENMAHHIAIRSQGAFTWTGPYGSGKSSLAVVLGALLNSKYTLKRIAKHALGEETASIVSKALPPRRRGWRILPVVGRRRDPVQVFGEYLESSGLVYPGAVGVWDERTVLDTLARVASENPKSRGGLIVIVDEMGKFLEHAAYEGGDIYFFQQLAEIASRSDNRLVFIGILHQAFAEHAHRLARETRDEWAKIQGRFVDLVVNSTADEQLDVLGRAIESDQVPHRFGDTCKGIAEFLDSNAERELDDFLKACWPLHPMVALLLGSISRRRFGQNQRSIFGFLNSSEPKGFQEFLAVAGSDDVYTVDRLWDYLQINLEPSIVASPDGHRWAMVAEAIGRCHSAGGNDAHIRLLKAIGLIELFKERTGLTANPRTLSSAWEAHPELELAEYLIDLENWSLIVHRRFNDSYSVFEGSDFDIEKAVEDASLTANVPDYFQITKLSGFQPVVAKRHYHDTGVMRWFDTAVVDLDALEDFASNYTASSGALGAFVLALPMQGDNTDVVEGSARRAARTNGSFDFVAGVPHRNSWSISALVRDLIALERVRDETPELQGDRVARAEVFSRIAELQSQIEEELNRALDDATWFLHGDRGIRLDKTGLNALASDLADARYAKTPRIHNELLNRAKPSSNAVAARNALLRRMTTSVGEERLGIEGYPPEGGLFDSVLAPNDLYRETDDGWCFVPPQPDDPSSNNLDLIWEAADEHLRKNAHRTASVEEIYDIWRRPPYGIRDGLLPVLATAYIQSRRSHVTLYRERIFQSRLTDLDVEILATDPSDIQIRWMELSDFARDLLSEMASVVRDMDPCNELSELKPIDVARGLVAIYDQLPDWIGRTQRLSTNAKRIRQLFKRASDPNRFIFDDIPNLPSNNSDGATEIVEIARHVRAGLSELDEAYGNMLNRMREILLTELGIPSASANTLSELRERADNIREVSGDHRLEAFILRMSRFQGTKADMESLASLASNKPPAQWVDSDIDRSTVELADLARRFTRLEAFAHVKGRQDRREAMAVVVGLSGEPIHDDFEIADNQLDQVNELMERVRQTLDDSGDHAQDVILAALARVTAEYLEARGSADRIRSEGSVA